MVSTNWFSRQTDVLVIIPAYNEEGSIGEVVRQVYHHEVGDVLVVDDASADQTAQKARNAGAQVIRLPFNLGIGGAVQAGFKFAVEMVYPFVIRIDGDGQHRVDELKDILEVVRQGKADVAIGSRFLPGQHTYKPPPSRAMGIRWFAALIRLITHEPVYDPTSGMQALNGRAVSILARDYPQDYPEVEARVLLKKGNLVVVEVPAKMEPRTTGNSSITYVRAIYYMIKVSLATILTSLRENPKIDNKDT
jgi:glycosyltransferase involved in cell wall biosynthesis